MSQLTKIFLIFILANNCYAAKHPAIMVSIKPFYNICAKIMHTIGKPELLLKNNSSPHDYQLKPSDISLIQSSDLVIWGGPAIDGYLAKNLDNYPGKDLNLAKISHLNLLPIRDIDHMHDHGSEHDHAHEHFDPHFWLDPQNAILIAEAIANRLSEIDPSNKSVYMKNATDFKNELNGKLKVWQKSLASAKPVSFIVFHDAYQYFEKSFNLQSAGAISLNPEIPPSAKRIQDIQNLLEQKQVKCIFSEPQFNPKIINTVSEGIHVYQGVLDPLGQDKDLGAQGYITLIEKLVNSFSTCSKFSSN